MLTDLLGSVRELVSAGGSVEDQIAYDAYGNVVSETNAAAGPSGLLEWYDFIPCTPLITLPAAAIHYWSEEARGSQLDARRHEILGRHRDILRLPRQGMMMALPAAEWEQFREMTIAPLAATLKRLARKANLSAYQRQARGPKKPQPERIHLQAKGAPSQSGRPLTATPASARGRNGLPARGSRGLPSNRRRAPATVAASRSLPGVAA
jgi:hypothetical protein